MATKLVAPLLLLVLLLAVPGTASAAQQFIRVDPGQYKLQRQYFDSEAYQQIAQLQAAGFKRVGVGGMMKRVRQGTAGKKLGPLNRAAVAGIPGVSGYSFNPQDNADPNWLPQGITNSQDAGRGPGLDVHSWYRSGEVATRASFADRGACRRTSAKCRYGLATFVNPRGGGGFDQVQNHAGGVAWSGPYIYLAETGFGLKVFDVRQIMRVPKSRRGETYGSKFVLPEVGRYAYDDSDASLSFSALSLDRKDPARPALVVGEYETPDPDKATEIARWEIDPGTNLLRTVGANQAWKTDNWQLQGVLTRGRRLFVSSSASDRGRLYFGRSKRNEGAPNRKVRDCNWGKFPEGLAVSRGRLWSLTEMANERTVFGIRLGRLGGLRCAN